MRIRILLATALCVVLTPVCINAQTASVRVTGIVRSADDSTGIRGATVRLSDVAGRAGDISVRLRITHRETGVNLLQAQATTLPGGRTQGGLNGEPALQLTHSAPPASFSDTRRQVGHVPPPVRPLRGTAGSPMIALRHAALAESGVACDCTGTCNTAGPFLFSRRLRHID